jgi:hypothetical protein
MSNNRESGTRTDQLDKYANLEKFEFQFKDFEIFYDKFISDSIYQITKVQFPIKGVLADYEGEKEWTKETWPFMKWDLRKEIRNTDDSITIDQSNDRFFFGSYCRDCGFSFEMSFDKNDNEWYLTYRQENNY